MDSAEMKSGLFKDILGAITDNAEADWTYNFFERNSLRERAFLSVRENTSSKTTLIPPSKTIDQVSLQLSNTIAKNIDCISSDGCSQVFKVADVKAVFDSSVKSCNLRYVEMLLDYRYFIENETKEIVSGSLKKASPEAMTISHTQRRAYEIVSRAFVAPANYCANKIAFLKELSGTSRATKCFVTNVMVHRPAAYSFIEAMIYHFEMLVHFRYWELLRMSCFQAMSFFACELCEQIEDDISCNIVAVILHYHTVMHHETKDINSEDEFSFKEASMWLTQFFLSHGSSDIFLPIHKGVNNINPTTFFFLKTVVLMTSLAIEIQQSPDDVTFTDKTKLLCSAIRYEYWIEPGIDPIISFWKFYSCYLSSKCVVNLNVKQYMLVAYNGKVMPSTCIQNMIQDFKFNLCNVEKQLIHGVGNDFSVSVRVDSNRLSIAAILKYEIQTLSSLMLYTCRKNAVDAIDLAIKAHRSFLELKALLQDGIPVYEKIGIVLYEIVIDIILNRILQTIHQYMMVIDKMAYSKMIIFQAKLLMQVDKLFDYIEKCEAEYEGIIPVQVLYEMYYDEFVMYNFPQTVIEMRVEARHEFLWIVHQASEHILTDVSTWKMVSKLDITNENEELVNKKISTMIQKRNSPKKSEVRIDSKQAYSALHGALLTRFQYIKVGKFYYMSKPLTSMNRALFEEAVSNTNFDTKMFLKELQSGIEATCHLKFTLSASHVEIEFNSMTKPENSARDAVQKADEMARLLIEEEEVAKYLSASKSSPKKNQKDLDTLRCNLFNEREANAKMTEQLAEKDLIMTRQLAEKDQIIAKLQAALAVQTEEGVELRGRLEQQSKQFSSHIKNIAVEQAKILTVKNTKIEAVEAQLHNQSRELERTEQDMANEMQKLLEMNQKMASCMQNMLLKVSSDSECVICLGKSNLVQFQPCGCQVACSSCSEHLLAKQYPCPQCQMPFEHWK